MNRPETEQQAREWLANAVKPKRIADSLWSWLQDFGYVRGFLSGEDPSGAELLKATRQVHRIARDVSHTRGLARPNTAVLAVRRLLTEDEAERARVFSVHVGRVAAADGRVVAFRSRVLQGVVQSPSGALAFLESPAIYLLSKQDFAALEVPIVGHVAKASLRPRQSGPGRLEWSQTIRLRMRAGRRSIARVFRLDRRIGEVRLNFPDGLGQGFSELPVRAGSIAEDLLRVSQWLHDIYPWEERDALWFVLTNQAPWIPPLQVGTRARRFRERFEHVVMDFAVEPWVSAATVMRVFRACQREAIGPKKNRGSGVKNLALLDFVGVRLAANPKAGYPELTDAWNARHPEWRVSDYRHFRRAYLSTRSRVLRPGYGSSAVAVALAKLAGGKDTGRVRKAPKE